MLEKELKFYNDNLPNWLTCREGQFVLIKEDDVDFFNTITGTPIKVNVLRAIGANLAGQDLIALLGRDMLQNFAIFYNGMMGQITLSF